MTAEVAVIMPAYNAALYVASALASLCREDGAVLDIIVVDDGSEDDTRAIVGSLAAQDPRIRLLAGPHRGIAATRNAGLAAAGAPFITFLDSDDLCPRGKIARQLTRLRATPEADLLIGDSLLFEKIGGDDAPVPGTRCARVLCVHLGAALFRRTVFEQCGGFDPEMEPSEDVDFYLRLFDADIAMTVEADLALLHRRHATNVTNDSDHTRRRLLRAFHKSLVRRRATGTVRPYPELFHRRHALEQEFRGDPTKP
jgi:glycosyltransferase involved in cell wall biosynthesis